MNLKKDCFNSIEDLPIWNWWKISEEGDLKYLFIKGEGKVTGEVYELWMDIQQEYFDNYGISEGLKETLKLKLEWIKEKAKFISTGDTFHRMKCNMLEVEMNDTGSGSGLLTNDDTIIFLEEKLGREVDPQNISVKKYTDYIRYYQKIK